MRDAGISAEQALGWLRQIEIIPVFTAHPTDVARRVMHFKQRRIAHELETLDRLPLTDSEASRGQQAMLAEITHSGRRMRCGAVMPPVVDEIKMGLDHYPDSLITPLSKLYEDISDAFREIFGVDFPPADLPTVIRFGSWIGGDRDGNPYVTSDSTREALQKAREVILGNYLGTVEELRRLLTPSLSRVAITPQLADSVAHYHATLTMADAERETIPEWEPYRRFAGFMLHRLRLTLYEPNHVDAYPDAALFIDRPAADP